MVKQYKIDEVEKLVSKLDARNNLILTNYTGTTVKALNSLRNQLREKDAEYKVVKNNLFKLALEKKGFERLKDYVKGPIAVAFVTEDVGEVAKILKDFSKDQKYFALSAGFVDETVYDEQQISAIAELPPMDVLLGQTMSLINGPASGIAMAMNQIMASLARGIQAVAEANNN